ncbi:MurR/RpiR family transcriptional regulator [Microbacterium keratanolyticum]|uniref:MurR/RpiR family transcriptional regulator n=1 Tax=Microbacterium keratanolyticum TaxID=67574 RepID=UPI0036401979
MTTRIPVEPGHRGLLAPDQPAVTDQIRLALPRLSPSMLLVARRVLDDPEGVASLSAAQLAAEVGVSQPTVTRFCQAVGLSSYQALLLHIAQESGRAQEPRWISAGYEEIGPEDDLEHVIQVMTSVDVDAMQFAARSLDRAALEEAAAVVASARSVDVYGAGASAVISNELELRMLGIGIQIRAWTAMHSALSSAALRRPGDAAIAISASGRTREVYDALSEAKSRGAATIAVTGDANSPLARVADIHLTAIGREMPYRTASFAARHAQLLVLDVLYTRVAQRDPQRSAETLAATAHIPSTHALRANHRAENEAPR